MDKGGRRMLRWVIRLAAPLLGCTALVAAAPAAERDGRALTVTAPRPRQAPAVPSQILPGAPIPWSGSPLLTPPDLSIVDGRTRFLTAGPAQDRCPGDRVVFVPGVVTPFRPTVPGDGAFMCHGDAVAQDFLGPDS